MRLNTLLNFMARPQRWLWGVLLLAAALPQARLHRSLWSDEAVSWWFARLPRSTLFYDLCDPHPPGYYLLLSGWQGWGQQELWLRLPSLGAALLAIALTYRLGRRMCGRRCALWAALLVALHPLQSWYSAEARMYALVQLLSLLLVWAGWRIISAPKQRARWGAYSLFVLAALAAFGADYGALLPWGLLQLVWLARGRPQPRRWLALQLLTLALVALVWLTPSQVRAFQQGYVSIFIAIQLSRLGGPALAPEIISRLLLAGLAGVALLSAGLAWRWPALAARFRRNQIFALGVVFGWLLLLALAAWPRAYTLKRQLVVLLPYLALATAYFLSRGPRLGTLVVAAGGLWVTSFILPHHPPEPWPAVLAGLSDNPGSSPPTIWVDELAVPAFSYYFSGITTEPEIKPPPVVYLAEPDWRPDSALPAGPTLWLVGAHSRYRQVTTLLPPDFNRYYQLQDSLTEAGIAAYRYRRREVPLASGGSPPARPAQSALWAGRLPSPLGTCAPD